MDPIDRFKIEYFRSYIKKFEDYEVICNIFKNLSNYVLNPRFDEIITEPMDLNLIFQDCYNDGSKSLLDFFDYLKKILRNIFQYYEPESLAYRAALNLQRYSSEKFTRLNHKEVRFDKAVPSVQEILYSIFVETYNCKNADGKYLSESILKLPANGWIDGVWTRVETLETIKWRLEEGFYSNLEELQTSLFNVFSRARQSWQLNKDLYKDSVELQGAYINIRNTLCQHGTMQSSQACSFGLNEFLNAVQDEKQNQNIDINAENQIASPDVEHHTSITNQFGEKFNIGDFIYVNPLEFDSVSDCLIMEIHKIITDKDGQNIVYGWQFIKPQDINIYHGHIMNITPGIDGFCLFTVKFHNQELLKGDKFLYMPMSKVVKKCLIVTPLDYSEFHLNNVFNPDIYSCRYSYKFSTQKFEKLVMDDSQFSFSTDMEKDMHYLFDLKVTKRFQQWSKLQEQTESINNDPQLMRIGSNCVKSIENLKSATDQSVDQLHDYAHQTIVRPNDFQSEISSVERISNLPSFELIVENSNKCLESAAATATISQPLSFNSGIKTENVEMGISEIDSNEEEFASEDINDGVSFIQCNSVVGILKSGDFVYIQSKPEAEKAIVHISEIILSKTCDFMIIGTKFVIQDKSPDSDFQNLISFHEAYWNQQRSIHPLSHVVGRCMVLNFQDYLYLRPSSIPEGDVYLCEFIFDRKKHCLFPLKFGMPEVLHLEVIKVKMQRVAENFIFNNICRRHVIYGTPIPILSDEIDKNTLSGQSTNPVINLRCSPKISVKKELIDAIAFAPAQSSVDKFEIWQKDLMSWLKEQKRLANKVFFMDFNRQAERYSKIYKLSSSSLQANIKYFKHKYRDIILRLELIKNNRGRPHSSKNSQSAIQECETKDEQKKPSCQQSKAADRFEIWQKDLMIWLKKQKQMNNIVSCNDFKRRAYFYCTIYQLGDKLKHVKYFKREYENIISSEQLINDGRLKRLKRKRKSKVETNQYFENEMTEDIEIWQQNLLSWLRDQKKLGHTTFHREFYRKSFILYQDLRLETSLVEQIIQFKKKYRDIILNEKLLKHFPSKKKRLAVLESNKKVKSLPEKEAIHFTTNEKFGRKGGRPTRDATLRKKPNEMNMSVKSSMENGLLLSRVSSKLSVTGAQINFRSGKTSIRNVEAGTSDVSESEICTPENSEVQSEIIKIWERELLHWLRTKKRLCETVTLEDFHEKAIYFQNILKVASPLESKVKNFKERYHDHIMKESLILFNVEKEMREPTIKSKICSNGCGFFGSTKTVGLCSKCYEDSLDGTMSSCSSTSAFRSSSPSDSSPPSPDSSSNPTSSSPINESSPAASTSIAPSRSTLRKSVLHKCYFIYKRQQYEILKTRFPDFEKSRLSKIISDEWKAFPKDVKLSYMKETKEKSTLRKSVLLKCYFIYMRQQYEILKTRFPDFEKSRLSKIISDEWKAFPKDVKLSYMKEIKEKSSLGKSVLRKCYFIYKRQQYEILKTRFPDFEKSRLSKIISDEWKAFPKDVKLSYMKETNEKITLRKSMLRKCYFIYMRQRYEILKTRLPDFEKSRLTKIISEEWKAFSLDVKLSYMKATKEKKVNESTEHEPTKIFKQNMDRPNNKIIEKSPVAEVKLEERNDSTEHEATKIFKQNRDRPNNKIIEKSPVAEVKVEEGNDSSEHEPTKIFKRGRGRPKKKKKKILEKPLVVEEKVETKTLHGRTFLEDMEEIERRRRLCIDSFKNSDQDTLLVKEFNKDEGSSTNFMSKYLEQLLEFFELPPDDLESYATFKWLQSNMDALRLSKNSLEDRAKEHDMNETWLNYGPRLAELALIHRLKENPLALGEFEQLAMSTPLLQIPKMSLSYENLS